MTMIYTYDGSTSSCNLTTTATTNNTADMFYYLKQTLKQAGWTVTKSSDGVTVNASGDRITNFITTGGNTSGSMYNSGAWYVLQAPGSVAGATRQICVQRTSTGGQCFSIWYSYNSGFTLTAGSATVAPTASDSISILSNTYFTSNGVATTCRFSIAADNAAPYGWYMFSFVAGSGAILSSLVFEPMTTGTYNSSDNDPYIIYTPGGSGTLPTTPMAVAGLTGTTLNLCAGSWYKKSAGSVASASELGSYVATPALSYASAVGVAIPGLVGANPYSGKDNVFPIPYARRSGFASSVGWKGIGTLMKWPGTTRSTGDTLSVSATGAKDYIIVGDVALPWNGSTPTV